MNTTTRKREPVGGRDAMLGRSLALPARERPILFSGEMVRAILEGRKTQTRRVVKLDAVLTREQRKIGFEFNETLAAAGDLSWLGALAGERKVMQALRREQQLNVPVRHPADRGMAWEDCGRNRLYCPWPVGSRIWVRETFQALWKTEAPGCWKTGEGYRVVYPATDQIEEFYDEYREKMSERCWPSIHMPRWASRITLEVTGVRVERLQDISEEDARAEGVSLRYPEEKYIGGAHRAEFSFLWRQLCGGIEAWAKNPWVWVVEFKRVLEKEVA